MDKPQTLQQLFECQATENSQGLAVIYNEEKLSYSELNQRANQLAHYLRQQQVGPDTLVALCLDRSIELIIAIVAVLKAGGAYIPLDSNHPQERLLLILKEANNPLVIRNKASKNKLSLYRGISVDLSMSTKINKQPKTNPERINKPHDLAYVIYTSGSTGKPKGVLIEQHSLMNYAQWVAKAYDWQPGQRIDFSSNPAFDFALTLSLVPLINGLTLVLCDDMEKKDPPLYLRYIREKRINTIKLTPSYFRVLLHEAQRQKADLSCLKQIILGGENLPAMDCKAWLDLYPKQVLINEYGPTETTVAVSIYPFSTHKISSPDENVPIGYLAPNVEAYLLDEQGQLVQNGGIGELCIGGACIARGYLNNPELTAKAFIKNPFNSDPHSKLYKTGDLCNMLADGALNCIGRIDHQIKIRGYRVELEEIEYTLCQHPFIKTAVVIAAERDTKEKSLIAYYILKNAQAHLDSNDLSQYLKNYLPDYMIPSALVRMDALPLNANEKLDRGALPVPLYGDSQYFIAPTTTTEIALARIWSEELGMHPVGILDDFFALGGHSLLAARVVSRIQMTLGKQISLLNLYQNPKIKDLACLVSRAPKLRKRKQKKRPEKSILPLCDFQLTLWLANTFEPKASKLNIYARQRIYGRLDLANLKQAFARLLEKHEVLFYRTSALSPTQVCEGNLTIDLHENDLSHLTIEEQVKSLESASLELMKFHPWPKNKPQLLVKLFYLGENETELQLALPHLISDDFSPEIIIRDVADFYNETQETVPRDKGYRDYIVQEQDYLERYFNRDMAFWDSYLKDSALFIIPQQYIIQKPKTYSTYIEIPEENIKHLQNFCAKKHISIIDGLSAALMLALAKCCPQPNPRLPLFINRVKSTRNDRSLDRTLGCFLRLEPIKLRLDPDMDLDNLSQIIHEAVVDTDLYQNCPTIVKLASIGTFRQFSNPLKDWFIKMAVWLYTTLIFKSEMNKKIFNLLGRLSAVRGANYMININLHNNFFNHKPYDKNLFAGCELQPVSPVEHDLIQIDNFLDFCFTRRLDSDKAFLVISANLEPALKEKLGQEIIQFMASA